MNHPQQQESREHCPNCPDCGRGGCSIRHQKVGSRGGNKAIKHEYYHCQNKSQQQESWREQFNRKFTEWRVNQADQYQKMFKPYTDPDDVEAFISTQRQRVMEEVRELVDGMRLETHETEALRRQLYGYNQALDDLLQAIEKLKEEHE